MKIDEMRKKLWIIQQFLETEWEKYDPDIRAKDYLLIESLIDFCHEISSGLSYYNPNDAESPVRWCSTYEYPLTKWLEEKSKGDKNGNY